MANQNHMRWFKMMQVDLLNITTILQRFRHCWKEER